MRFEFGSFELDDKRFTLTGPAGPVHIEPQVFGILHHLITNRDRVVPKEELLDEIWGDRFVSESALTTRIKQARQAVGDDGQAQQVIKTVHARGYQFVAPVRTESDGGARPRQRLPRLRNVPLGREGDIGSVAGLTGEASLVTIIGPGGIGKTTVAVAVAGRVQDAYADGVVFVDLVPVPPQSDITRAVADAAGIEGGASETIERVAEHLANRPVLLVLDNCEHVLERAAELADRMLACNDSARVLATSREPLGVAGEHVWPLGPLEEDGPALFVERARAAEPRVQWDATDPAVIELCRRLDFVPLALELAAGQLRRFDLDELNRQLDDRLALLSGRAAGDAPRHTTMETAIDWSYRLLEPEEQCLLRHISVFPSTFAVGAVEASAPPLGATDAVTVFGALVDKSLVVRLPGSGRYRLLETIRAFARDRLDEAGEATAAFERHRCAVRDRVTRSARLDRWMSARLAAQYRTDLEDARQAFRLSLLGDHAEDAVEIAVGASLLWRDSVGCAEGDTWVSDLMGRQLSAHDQVWVQILRADVGQGRGDDRQMFGAGAEASSLVDGTDDPVGACLATHYASLAELTDSEDPERSFAVARSFAEQAGDRRLVTLVRAFVGVAQVVAGEYDLARRAFAELEHEASADGHDRFIFNWAGWMLGLAERDAATVRRYMSAQQDYLDRTGIVETWLTSFSMAMCDVLDGGEVRNQLAHTLDLADREGYAAEPDCALVLAFEAICADRFEEAAELVGTAIGGRFNATAHYVLFRAVLDRALREQLEPAVLDEAMRRGRSRSPVDALAERGITRRPGVS